MPNQLPLAISKIWERHPEIKTLTEQELVVAAAFVEQWERGLLSLDDMPASMRKDLMP